MWHKKTTCTVLASLGVVFLISILPALDASASTQPAAVKHQRALTLMRLLCEDSDDSVYLSEFPGAVLEPRQDLARSGQVFGWRQNLVFADQHRAVLERIAPQGHLRRVTVELRDTESLPRLLLLADQDCALREARSIRYQDGHAVSLQVLDRQLQPTGSASPMNPPIPKGENNGLVGVALVDSGVNYLLPAIAQHLARDAQGIPLGFDFWDMDARPFDSHPVRSVFFPQRHGTRTASIIIREAPQIRLVPYRYPRPDMQRMKDLIGHAAAAGVRVVNMSLGSNRESQWVAFEYAALMHPEILFVVSAGNNGRNIDLDPVYPASLPLENMLVVSSVAPDGYPADGANWGRDSVDLLAPGERIAALDFSGEAVDVSGSSYAAARVSALASRILMSAPELTAIELREAILSLVQPAPGNFVRYGLIAEPSDLVREGDLQSLVVRSLPSWQDQYSDGSEWFMPTFVVIRDSGWEAKRVQDIVQKGAALIAPCGITLKPAVVLEVEANTSLRDFSRSNAKLLSGKVAPGVPRVFFVRDTLDRPAYDAVTFGTANSRRNPELRFTVWMTAVTRDPHIALAHELAHVLLDDGAHSTLPRNLMRADTSPDNLKLTAEQCTRMRDTARNNGLLH